MTNFTCAHCGETLPLKEVTLFGYGIFMYCGKSVCRGAGMYYVQAKRREINTRIRKELETETDPESRGMLFQLLSVFKNYLGDE